MDMSGSVVCLEGSELPHRMPELDPLGVLQDECRSTGYSFEMAVIIPTRLYYRQPHGIRLGPSTTSALFPMLRSQTGSRAGR